MNKRLDSIDILKGIGITLVLFGHLPIPEAVKTWIYSFHMPLFFFCSGLFSRPKPLFTALKKDMRTTLVPYLFFCSILILTMLTISMVHLKSISAAFLSLKLNPFDNHCYPLYHTIWFLVCLFFVREISNIFGQFRRVSGIAAGGYFVAYLLRVNDIHVPFFIDTALGVMFFFWLGRVFMQSKWAGLKPNLYFATLVLVLYTILVAYLHPDVNIRDNQYPWYLCLTAPVPVLALYYLSVRLSQFDNRIIQWMKVCGVSSLFLFALHGPIYEFGFILSGRLGLEEW